MSTSVELEALPRRPSLNSSVPSRQSWGVLPAGWNCWATTPTTTAAWSWPWPSTASRSPPDAPCQDRSCHVHAVNFHGTDSFNLDKIERRRERGLGELCQRRGLGNSGCSRAAPLFGIRAGDRWVMFRWVRVCPVRPAWRRPSPSSCSGRASSRAAPARSPSRVDRPGPDGSGQDPQAVGERLRGCGIGLARPVLQPVWPGPTTPFISTARPSITPGFPWVIRARRSWSVTRRHRAGSPTACTTSGAPSARRS